MLRFVIVLKYGNKSYVVFGGDEFQNGVVSVGRFRSGLRYILYLNI